MLAALHYCEHYHDQICRSLPRRSHCDGTIDSGEPEKLSEAANIRQFAAGIFTIKTRVETEAQNVDPLATHCSHSSLAQM